MQIEESNAFSMGSKILVGIPLLVVILMLILTAIDIFPFVKHDVLSLLGLLD